VQSDRKALERQHLWFGEDAVTVVVPAESLDSHVLRLLATSLPEQKLASPKGEQVWVAPHSGPRHQRIGIGVAPAACGG
jgi:hypothetical protein